MQERTGHYRRGQSVQEGKVKCRRGQTSTDYRRGQYITGEDRPVQERTVKCRRGQAITGEDSPVKEGDSIVQERTVQYMKGQSSKGEDRTVMKRTI